MKKYYPGINIQWPISRLILDGQKTIETRTYAMPKDYIGKEMALIETPGPDGAFKARVVAIIKFEASFEYKSKKHFYDDEDRHKVSRDSTWAWEKKKKWGWPVSVVRIIDNPEELNGKKGIRFTKKVMVTF